MKQPEIFRLLSYVSRARWPILHESERNSRGPEDQTRSDKLLTIRFDCLLVIGKARMNDCSVHKAAAWES